MVDITLTEDGVAVIPGITVPAPVELITVTVDVQNAYLAVLTTGWAPTAEVWVLDYETVEDDPRDPRTLHDLLHGLRRARFQYATPQLAPVHLVGIDSGFLTDVVYQAVDTIRRTPFPGFPGWRVFACKGIGGREGEPITVLPVRDVRGHEVRRHRPLLVNTDEAKGQLVAALKLKPPGRGSWHFPKRLGVDFIRQLTSEEARPRFDREGVPVGVEWKKKAVDRRNEALDCAVMALALFHTVRPRDWLALLTARHAEGGLAIYRDASGGPDA
jgi:phage terminase large subunit GpA-like protein